MYKNFAKIYDALMQEVPYEKWSLHIIEWIETYGISKPNENKASDIFKNKNTKTDPHTSEKNLVLDLGCGTGTLTELLAEKGYDMVGIDNSAEMLNIAIEKKDVSGNEILYLCQNMQEMELYSTVGTIICSCDSLNYLLTDEDALKTFKLINNYLYPGGILIFDFNTIHKYKEVIGDSIIAENYEDCAFIWENYYHDEDNLNEYDLTFFIEDGENRFERFYETHFQKGYTLEQVYKLLDEAGLEPIMAIDDDFENEPDEKSERIFVIARKKRLTRSVNQTR